MEILELIRNADSAPEILTALGAYVETLRHLDSLPDFCLRVPVEDYRDIYARMFALMAILNTAASRPDNGLCSVAKEALQIFAAAARRLRPRDARKK